MTDTTKAADPSTTFAVVTPDVRQVAGRPHLFCRFCRFDTANRQRWERHTETVHKLRPLREDADGESMLDAARDHERQARALRKLAGEADPAEEGTPSTTTTAAPEPVEVEASSSPAAETVEAEGADQVEATGTTREAKLVRDKKPPIRR